MINNLLFCMCAMGSIVYICYALLCLIFRYRFKPGQRLFMLKLMYMPSSSEEAFAQKWTQDFLNKSFRGSLKAFICTLTGSHDLSEEEKKMLRNLYDDK